MVLIAISEKEEKFKEEVCSRIWCELEDILLENGIDIIFLQDSKDIKFAIETIENRLWFWIANVKKDKELIKSLKEGKELEEKIKQQEK